VAGVHISVCHLEAALGRELRQRIWPALKKNAHEGMARGIVGGRGLAGSPRPQAQPLAKVQAAVAVQVNPRGRIELLMRALGELARRALGHVRGEALGGPPAEHHPFQLDLHASGVQPGRLAYCEQQVHLLHRHALLMPLIRADPQVGQAGGHHLPHPLLRLLSGGDPGGVGECGSLQPAHRCRSQKMEDHMITCERLPALRAHSSHRTQGHDLVQESVHLLRRHPRPFPRRPPDEAVVALGRAAVGDEEVDAGEGGDHRRNTIGVSHSGHTPLQNRA
jgi:hypothetical protein